MAIRPLAAVAVGEEWRLRREKDIPLGVDAVSLREGGVLLRNLAIEDLSSWPSIPASPSTSLSTCRPDDQPQGPQMTHDSVTCQTCKRDYETFIPGRGKGCAGTLDASGKIEVFHGSDVWEKGAGILDFVSSHALIESSPIHPGPICDNCILGYLLDSAVKIVSPS